MAYKRKLFDPKSTNPFKVSRAKIEIFNTCKRCFYLDLRLGVSRPSSFPFNLNNAVDLLLKEEFDEYREEGTVHPLVQKEGLSLVPFRHEMMDTWRNPFEGISHLHEESNFIFFGGVDDIWCDDKEMLYVVDYKATSKDGEITLDAPWQISYKRQIESYQWMLKQNGFSVSPIGYFVYANGDRNRSAFNDVLHFNTKLISYKGDSSWVPKTLIEARKVLSSEDIPSIGDRCDYCAYRENAGHSFKRHIDRE